MFDDLPSPVIFVANHSSHLDTPTILRALPRKWRNRTAVAAAADYFYKKRWKANGVALLFNTVPLGRNGGGLSRAARRTTSTSCIDKGWNLLMFPEGTRSRDGEIGKLRSGAAVIAAQHGIPIVPIHVSGTHDAMPPGPELAEAQARPLLLPPPQARGALRPADRGRASEDARREVMDEIREFWERDRDRRRSTCWCMHRVLEDFEARHPGEASPRFRRAVVPEAAAEPRSPGRRRLTSREARPSGTVRDRTPDWRGEMKKLINHPDAVVREALEGIEAAHGDRVRVVYEPMMIVRADAPVQGKVGIISGGGSGHEPMHGGFVGPGMLDAACPGEVFTSPTPDQMLEATKAVDGGAGVLHIVKNYTGDVLNFEMAADLAKGEGIEVEAVVTNDDVAVQDSLYTAGRRGVGITVIAEKICGAAAEEGKSLAEVAEVCRTVNGQGRTMGMALTPCITPGSGEPSFELADDEMEIGIGIHGEPGRYREKLGSAHDIVERLATAVVEDLPYESGDKVLAFVNGMGGTPLIELYIVYRELAKFLEGRGIAIERRLIGNYITSLEMAGCSITLLKLDDELTRLWDAPCDTPALRIG